MGCRNDREPVTDMKEPMTDMKMFFACCVAVMALSLSAGLSFDAPGHVFTDRETPTARGGIPGETGTLLDWRGRPAGTPVVWRADGTAVLPHLPTGYYHLKSGGDAATFAVVPVPESRVFDHASFYGVDSAQSWVARKGSFACPWNGGDTYRTVSDLIRLAGLPHVRERLSWSEVNPRPGSLDFSYYMYNADLLQARGLLVSGMFHDAPKWADRIVNLPRDLAAVHRFCAEVASAFGSRMGDWEFWNEEDIGFAPEPVWDYAAALKAAALGFKSTRPDMPVLPGALCQRPDSPYTIALLENDTAKYWDVFNYHVYEPLSRYQERIATLRAVLARYGAGDRPIWVTECGTNLEGLSARTGAMAGKMAHSPEQELILAEFYPKAQIALQMAGVARNYHFVFGAYNEVRGAKDWGVMRRDGTVKPIYAAMSAMTHELVSARLVGEIKVGEGLRAYLFRQPDGEQTMVFWAVSRLDTATGGTVSATPDGTRPLRIAAPDGTYRLTDLCGARSSITAKDGNLSLEATRYPAYVSGLHGLTADILPQPCGRMKSPVASADEDRTVIIRAEFDTKDFEISNQKTRAVLKGNTGRVRIIIWNRGETAKTGTVAAAGVRLAGLPERPFALAPRGSAPAVFDCAIAPGENDPADTALVLTGRFGGKRTSRLHALLLIEKRYLAGLERQNIAWSDPKAWKRNTSAQEYSVQWDEKEQAIRFDVTWTDPLTDRWFYPVYTLNKPEESLKGACMVEFEVKTAQDKVENDFKRQHLMLLYEDSSRDARFLDYPAPVGSWERRYVELGEGADLGTVKAFRLGVNPKGQQMTYWVRNIVLLKKPTP